ncbi:MAG: protein phosphatase 2C domain-containing protein [Victivallaceae bacterium]|nr:protein phosphatase 2C domain-containing protein [Victivallaceae bacterium]
MLEYILNRFCGRRRFTAAAESLIGLVRENNEDSFACSFGLGARNALLVVADGIGGHANGEVASRMCCDIMIEEWEKNHAGRRRDFSGMPDFMKWMIESANSAVYDRNCLEKLRRPMGCTVVAAIVTCEQLVIGHAGDSRCYGVNGDGGLEQLTDDHTLRASIIRKASCHVAECDLPASNIISKAVGPAKHCNPTVSVFPRTRFSRLMLCSDGLTGMVDDAVISDMLCRGRSPREVTSMLTSAAMKNGGGDNITVITAFC